MAYPRRPDLNKLISLLWEHSQLKHEHGAKGIEKVYRKAEKALRAALEDVQELPIDKKLAAKEPDDLEAIKAMRPKGPRKMWERFDAEAYVDRLYGAMLGRFAGCTLGAPVEFWSIYGMEKWAEEIGQPFPPVEYWRRVPYPHHLRYEVSRCDAYTSQGMDGVPVDDDIAYTLLGLLTVERFGPRFTVDDNGRSWLKHLPYTCTAEDIALKNLKKKIPARKCGELDNPFREWIGADIRSDPWGYMAPAWPEFAADMAYRDAYLSHRR